jgi:hypothetical protein
MYCRGTSVKSNCASWVLGELKLFRKKSLFKHIYKKNKMLSLVVYTEINPAPLMCEDVDESTKLLIEIIKTPFTRYIVRICDCGTPESRVWDTV